jgi:hypothetical protein
MHAEGCSLTARIVKHLDTANRESLDEIEMVDEKDLWMLIYTNICKNK